MLAGALWYIPVRMQISPLQRCLIHLLGNLCSWLRASRRFISAKDMKKDRCAYLMDMRDTAAGKNRSESKTGMLNRHCVSTFFINCVAWWNSISVCNNTGVNSQVIFSKILKGCFWPLEKMKHFDKKVRSVWTKVPFITHNKNKLF